MSILTTAINNIFGTSTLTRKVKKGWKAIKQNATNKGINVEQNVNDTIVYTFGAGSGVIREAAKTVNYAADKFDIDAIVTGGKNLYNNLTTEDENQKVLRELLEEANIEIERAAAEKEIAEAKAELAAVKGE